MAGHVPFPAGCGVIDRYRRTDDPIRDAKPLIIGEGIETAAAAAILFGWPAWSAISCGNLGAGLVLPREVRRVRIAADPGEPGRKAARDAWFRWKAEGRDVTIATPTGDGDFNDVLCREVSHVG